MAVFDVSQYKTMFQEAGYADEHAATLLLRTQLLKAIKKEIEAKNWTQITAAEKLGVKQPRISEIYALRIDKFSAELLVKYLFKLGKEVKVDLRKASV